MEDCSETSILNRPTGELAVFRPENLLQRATAMMGRGPGDYAIVRRNAR